MFNIVLIEPEIPPNTGNIGRLCLATGSRLHLVEPLGFSLDDKTLLRAGLDYWKDIECLRWPNFAALQNAEAEAEAEGEERGARFFYFTTKTTRRYWDVRFKTGDYLVFGRESKGLPESLLAANEPQCLTIPQIGTRSLNLATSVGIGLYEAWRQVEMATLA